MPESRASREQGEAAARGAPDPMQADEQVQDRVEKAVEDAEAEAKGQ